MGGLFCGGWFLSRLISLLMNGNDSAAKEHRKGKINDGKMQSKVLVELAGPSWISLQIGAGEPHF
jgi:hypothetical protein